jgi:hypothetical protein
MKRTMLQRSASLPLASAAAMSLVFLSGCAESPRPVSAPTPVVASDARVVQHQTGRYELRGQGTAGAPYYWVWIPTGSTLASLPALPAVPTTAVTASADRIRTFSEGRYELVGEGSREAPYYWVWLPTGATAPPPPPLPRRQSP